MTDGAEESKVESVTPPKPSGIERQEAGFVDKQKQLEWQRASEPLRKSDRQSATHIAMTDKQLAELQANGRAQKFELVGSENSKNNALTRDEAYKSKFGEDPDQPIGKIQSAEKLQQTEALNNTPYSDLTKPVSADKLNGLSESQLAKYRAEKIDSYDTRQIGEKAIENPTMALYAEALKDTKDAGIRQELKQQATDLDRQSQNIAEVRVDGSVNLKINEPISPESKDVSADKADSKDDRKKLENTPAGWLNALHKISELPLDKQLQVLGSGLQSGLESYAHDQRERAIGSLIGTVEGTGEVLQGLAKVADFTAACILGDSKRAGQMGAEFGDSLGKTIVGGVRLFQAADEYANNVGKSGDYAKPFRDVQLLGQTLNEKWSELPPQEQERAKAKLITELIEGTAIGAAGASAIQKAGKFTEILDAIAVQASDLHAAAQPALKKGVQAISSALDELMAPDLVTPEGLRMRPPRESNKFEDFINRMEKYKEPPGEPLGGKDTLNPEAINEKDLPAKGGEIRSGELKGQDPEKQKLDWPAGWRKPKIGDFEVRDGELYLRPNEATRKLLGWQEGELLPFKNEVPDFREWSWGEKNFEIKTSLTGNQGVDKKLIATELARDGWEGCKNQAQVLRKLRDLELTPHHFQELEDGTNLVQLVDSFVHKTFRHTGTAAIQRGPK